MPLVPFNACYFVIPLGSTDCVTGCGWLKISNIVAGPSAAIDSSTSTRSSSGTRSSPWRTLCTAPWRPQRASSARPLTPWTRPSAAGWQSSRTTLRPAVPAICWPGSTLRGGQSFLTEWRLSTMTCVGSSASSRTGWPSLNRSRWSGCCFRICAHCPALRMNCQTGPSICLGKKSHTGTHPNDFLKSGSAIIPKSEIQPLISKNCCRQKQFCGAAPFFYGSGSLHFVF